MFNKVRWSSSNGGSKLMQLYAKIMDVTETLRSLLNLQKIIIKSYF